MMIMMMMMMMMMADTTYTPVLPLPGVLDQVSARFSLFVFSPCRIYIDIPTGL
jgi:hypothetical protein